MQKCCFYVGSIVLFEICTHQSIQVVHRFCCVYGVPCNSELCGFPCVLHVNSHTHHSQTNMRGKISKRENLSLTLEITTFVVFYVFEMLLWWVTFCKSSIPIRRFFNDYLIDGRESDEHLDFSLNFWTLLCGLPSRAFKKVGHDKGNLSIKPM